MHDLHAIVADVFDVPAEHVTPSLGPEDVERWDSLGQLALIEAVEGHFGVRFEVEEVFEIFTVGDIERLLQAKQGDTGRSEATP